MKNNTFSNFQLDQSQQQQLQQQSIENSDLNPQQIKNQQHYSAGGLQQQNVQQYIQDLQQQHQQVKNKQQDLIIQQDQQTEYFSSDSDEEKQNKEKQEDINQNEKQQQEQQDDEEEDQENPKKKKKYSKKIHIKEYKKKTIQCIIEKILGFHRPREDNFDQHLQELGQEYDKNNKQQLMQKLDQIKQKREQINNSNNNQQDSMNNSNSDQLQHQQQQQYKSIYEEEEELDEETKENNKNYRYLFDEFYKGNVHFNNLEQLEAIIIMFNKMKQRIKTKKHEEYENLDIKSIRINEQLLGAFRSCKKSPKNLDLVLQTLFYFAHQGEAWSQYAVAYLYYYGDKNIDVDYEMSYYWAHQSSKSLNIGGNYILGKLAEEGKGQLCSICLENWLDEKYRSKECDICKKIQPHPKTALKLYEKGGGKIIDEEEEEKKEEEELKQREKQEVKNPFHSIYDNKRKYIKKKIKFRFSPTLKNKDIELAENSATIVHNSDKKQELKQIFFEPPLQKYKMYEIYFKISSSGPMQNLAIGLSQLQTNDNNFDFTKKLENLGHGGYMLRQDGQVYSSHDKKLNREFLQDFSFSEGDIIMIRVDPYKNKLFYITEQYTYEQKLQFDDNNPFFITCLLSQKFDEIEFGGGCEIIPRNVNFGPSIHAIGMMYCTGSHGIKVDQSKAIEYFKTGQQKLYAASLYQIGLYYENGLSRVQRNQKIALQYFQQAADKGHYNAIKKVAFYLKTGRGIKAPQPKIAKQWEKIMHDIDNDRYYGKTRQKPIYDVDNFKIEIDERSEEQRDEDYQNYINQLAEDLKKIK